MLCKLNTLWNIWWYLVVTKNRTRWHVTYKNDNFGFFYFWSYLPFLCLNMNTLWNILMIIGRNIEQEEITCCIQEWELWHDFVGEWGGGGVGCGDIVFFLKKTFLVIVNQGQIRDSGTGTLSLHFLLFFSLHLLI